MPQFLFDSMMLFDSPYSLHPVAASATSSVLGLTKRSLDEYIVREVFEVVKRLRLDDNSRKGEITETRLVYNLRNENKLVEDPRFDAELESIIKDGDFWVESCDNPTTSFPPANVGEKSTVQPFFVDVMNKFVNCAKTGAAETVYKPDAAGKYIVPVQLPAVSCLPNATVHEMPTVGSRKPDINVYHDTAETKGILRIISSWELTPRAVESNHAFSADEIGQLIATNMELLRQQPFRTFTIAVLSDGVRFVFFKITRLSHHFEDFHILQSSTYLNMRGWAVSRDK